MAFRQLRPRGVPCARHTGSIEDLHALTGLGPTRFYAAAFGATERFRLVEPSGRIGHAELQLGPAVLMLSDCARRARGAGRRHVADAADRPVRRRARRTIALPVRPHLADRSPHRDGLAGGDAAPQYGAVRRILSAVAAARAPPGCTQRAPWPSKIARRWPSRCSSIQSSDSMVASITAK